MSNWAYPNLDHFIPDSFSLGLRSNVQVSTSTHNGSVQTVEMPGSRWVYTLTYGDEQSANLRAEVEAFWAKVRGQVHRVSLWHFRRPVPRGTLNTSGITVYTLQLSGATTIAFQGGALNQTLKQGDMFSVNGELKMVITDATFDASGRATISFSPPLRADAAANAAVTLVRPTANYVMTGTEVMVGYEGYTAQGFTVELVETFL